MARKGPDCRRRSAGVAERVIDPPLLCRSKKSSSTSKILDFFKSSPPTLDDALADLEQAARLAMKVAELQRRGADKLHKWAQAEGNAAISDVSDKVRQLMMMHSEQQLILAQEASDSMQDMRQMTAENAELVQVEKVKEQLEVEDKKIEKELNKMRIHSSSPSSSVDGNVVRSKLSERVRLAEKRDDAEDLIHRLRNDQEVARMFLFRRAVKGYADAFVNYAKNATVIFSATRELAELVPAVATEDVHHLRYEGGEVSKRKVKQVRRSLEQRTVTFREEQEVEDKPRLLGSPRRRVPVDPLKMGSSFKTVGGTPPPPYSPVRRT